MADGDDAQSEEQVVDQAEDRGQAEGPVAEAEPQVQQDRGPASDDGVQGAPLRLGRQLAVEVLQPFRLRAVLELLLGRRSTCASCSGAIGLSICRTIT